MGKTERLREMKEDNRESYSLCIKSSYSQRLPTWMEMGEVTHSHAPVNWNLAQLLNCFYNLGTEFSSTRVQLKTSTSWDLAFISTIYQFNLG